MDRLSGVGGAEHETGGGELGGRDRDERAGTSSAGSPVSTTIGWSLAPLAATTCGSLISIITLA